MIFALHSLILIHYVPDVGLLFISFPTYIWNYTISYFIFQDYMQNVHGKEIDLLRTTVKVPGKRPPRAVATVAPTASPKTNGLTKDRSTLQLGIGATSKCELIQ